MTDSEQPPEQGPEPLVFHLEPLDPVAHAAPGQDGRKRLPTALTVASLVVIAVLAVVVPLRAASTFVSDFTKVPAFCLVFAGLWLLTHRMGLLSIGHGALAAVAHTQHCTP